MEETYSKETCCSVDVVQKRVRKLGKKDIESIKKRNRGKTERATKKTVKWEVQVVSSD